jgi:hypothetical protein
VAVEPAEEAFLLLVVILGNRLEQRGAQRRREVSASRPENRMETASDSENWR